MLPALKTLLKLGLVLSFNLGISRPYSQSSILYSLYNSSYLLFILKSLPHSQLTDSYMISYLSTITPHKNLSNILGTSPRISCLPTTDILHNTYNFYVNKLEKPCRSSRKITVRTLQDFIFSALSSILKQNSI